MKKLLCLFALCMCFLLPLGTQPVFAESIQVKVIYTQIYAYSMTDVKNEACETVATFNYGEILQTTGEAFLGDDGFEYYQIVLNDNGNAYVLKSQVLNVLYESLKRELDSNAILAKDSTVYVQENNEMKATATVLLKDTKIRLINGFDGSKEYTLIQYQDENQNLIYGYIKTDTILKKGISVATIGAIIIIVTTISLAFLIFGISKKKKKSK